MEADSPQQVTGYGVELAFLSHHGLQQGGLPSVTSRGSLAGRGWWRGEDGVGAGGVQVEKFYKVFWLNKKMNNGAETRQLHTLGRGKLWYLD